MSAAEKSFYPPRWRPRNRISASVVNFNLARVIVATREVTASAYDYLVGVARCRSRARISRNSHTVCKSNIRRAYDRIWARERYVFDEVIANELYVVRVFW